MSSRVAERIQQSVAVLVLRRVLGTVGILLLGGALAWAPVAAFRGDMLMVTKIALAGLAFLIVMKLLPPRDATPEHRPEATDDNNQP